MSEINKLKRRVRQLYAEIHSADDWTCGRELASFIRPSISIAEREFEEVLARLREIDPECPRSNTR